MFLLVVVRHVGAHPDELQHGVSIQISINLGRIFLPISRKWYSCDLNLDEGLYLYLFTSFHFPDSGLYLLNSFDFYFDLFWMAWHWKPAIGDKTLWGRGEEFVSTYPYPERPYGRTYGDVITKFSRMDSLPNFITHGASCAEASLLVFNFLQICF